MEIHSPHSPVHSVKDFLIHLGIVTLGILIALGLDGLRESLHHRHMAEVARTNFRAELAANRAQVKGAADAVAKSTAAVTQLLAEPASARSQGRALQPALDAMAGDFVALKAAARDTSLSTGAASFMGYDEVRRYADAYTEQRALEQSEAPLQGAWSELSAYASEGAFSPADASAVDAKLRIAAVYLKALAQAQRRTLQAYDRAVSAGG